MRTPVAYLVSACTAIATGVAVLLTGGAAPLGCLLPWIAVTGAVEAFGDRPPPLGTAPLALLAAVFTAAYSPAFVPVMLGCGLGRHGLRGSRGPAGPIRIIPAALLRSRGGHPPSPGAFALAAEDPGCGAGGGLPGPWAVFRTTEVTLAAADWRAAYVAVFARQASL
ncbi:hypothetical protein [Actinoplanes sp. NPDC051851]|uniref:hypothetical protein n=1 Tax=Actinoplanes sp. NPDC051851 TaxID=3154753 RepID=UPI0034291072